MSAPRPKRHKPRRVLVFGEDENDTKLLAELLVALCPEMAGLVKPFRRPPILIKDADPRKVPSRVDAVATLIEAERASADVVCVFAHEDCDDFEPAHEGLSRKIEEGFASAGYHVHAVTPAWETEAWLLLWPDAVAAYRSKWASLRKYRGRDVGKVENAKEALTRALRPSGKGASAVRDYRESDAPAIAQLVRELGLARTPAGRSLSYERFCDQVDQCCEAVASR